jgi:hypothetical protein
MNVTFHTISLTPNLSHNISLRLPTDEEMNKDTPEDCFADGDLKKYLNKHGKSRKKNKEAEPAK